MDGPRGLHLHLHLDKGSTWRPRNPLLWWWRCHPKVVGGSQSGAGSWAAGRTRGRGSSSVLSWTGIVKVRLGEEQPPSTGGAERRVVGENKRRTWLEGAQISWCWEV